MKEQAKTKFANLVWTPWRSREQAERGILEYWVFKDIQQSMSAVGGAMKQSEIKEWLLDDPDLIEENRKIAEARVMFGTQSRAQIPRWLV